MKNQKYLHWVFGENILLSPAQHYILNLEYGLSIRFNYEESYFSSFEDFYIKIADIQFLNGNRPNDENLKNILIDAWNFLAEVEKEEEKLGAKLGL